MPFERREDVPSPMFPLSGDLGRDEKRFRREHLHPRAAAVRAAGPAGDSLASHDAIHAVLKIPDEVDRRDTIRMRLQVTPAGRLDVQHRLCERGGLLG